MEELLPSFLSALLFILTLTVMVVGVVLSLINMPGAALIFLAILLHTLITRFEDISLFALIIYFLAALLAVVADNITVPYGAKKMGAGRSGIIGAILGGIVGLLVGGIIGAILGPFVGATLFELLFEKKDMNAALRAGFGTFVGFISGIVLKFGISVAMILSWLYTLWS